MPRPNDALNQEHFDKPEVADYWSEHFVLYHIVLKVFENGNLIIAERDTTVTDYQCFDLMNAREINQAEHAKLVKYSSIPGFVADVSVGTEKAHQIVEEWETKFGGRYVALVEAAAEPTTDVRPYVPTKASLEEVQAVLDRVAAAALGYQSVEALIEAVPAGKRLPPVVTERERINHAFAIALGVDTIDEMVKESCFKGRIRGIDYNG